LKLGSVEVTVVNDVSVVKVPESMVETDNTEFHTVVVAVVGVVDVEV